MVGCISELADDGTSEDSNRNEDEDSHNDNDHDVLGQSLSLVEWTRADAPRVFYFNGFQVKYTQFSIGLGVFPRLHYPTGNSTETPVMSKVMSNIVSGINFELSVKSHSRQF